MVWKIKMKDVCKYEYINNGYKYINSFWVYKEWFFFISSEI